MKIKIWQLKEAHGDVQYMDYEWMEKHSVPVRKPLYESVWEGETKDKDLESVFATFNIPHLMPNNYHARSLSVSDVVEVLEDTDNIHRGAYFCDGIGWTLIPKWSIPMKEWRLPIK